MTTHKHSNSSALAFATRTIHAGQSPDPSTGAIMTPIYQTSTSPHHQRSLAAAALADVV